jgi:hypothetical protein
LGKSGEIWKILRNLEKSGEIWRSVEIRIGGSGRSGKSEMSGFGENVVFGTFWSVRFLGKNMRKSVFFHLFFDIAQGAPRNRANVEKKGVFLPVGRPKNGLKLGARCRKSKILGPLFGRSLVKWFAIKSGL